LDLNLAELRIGKTIVVGSSLNEIEKGEIPATMFIRQFWVAISLIGTFALVSCTSRTERIRAEIRSDVATELKSANTAFEAGQYVDAHGSYELAYKMGVLDEAQRREALDGLCLTENKIGPPQFPLQQQLESCAAAAVHSSSDVTAVLSDVEGRLDSQYSERIASLIAAKDAANAEEVVEQYRQLPHSDQSRIGLWQTQIDNILETTRIERNFDAAIHSCDSVSTGTRTKLELEGAGLDPKELKLDDPSFVRDTAAGVLGCYDPNPELKAIRDANDAALSARGVVDVCDQPVYFDCLFEYLQRAGLRKDQIYALGFCTDAKIGRGSLSIDQCVKDEASTHSRRRREILWLNSH
jgi:hypothetical protein